MKVIEEIKGNDFPFSWANLEYYPDTKSERVEIYLREDENLEEGLIFLFYSLFGKHKDEIFVYDKLWWDLCLDTWNIQEDSYDYDLDNVSKETRDYLQLLENAAIEKGYTGSCKCLDWDTYLPVLLRCILRHLAPYSSLFYSKEYNFFFYFHYTGSIGMYYHKNKVTDEILEIAARKYDLRK